MKAIYEMPVPESCFACLFCLPSDTRSGLFCRAEDLITDDYHSSRHPDCPLKIVRPDQAKKDLLIIGHRLFPNANKKDYNQLLGSYITDVKTNINPTILLDEAINKYTSQINTVVDDEKNWRKDWNGLFVEFRNFSEVFKEFFPVYYAENNYPCVDLLMENNANGKKIFEFVVARIFEQVYTGLGVLFITYERDTFCSPEFACIHLRSLEY